MSDRILVAVVLALLVVPSLPFTPGVSASAGPPTYRTYDGPADARGFVVFGGLGGEPSLGVVWETGEVLYQHAFQTFRVTFAPDGSADWVEVTAPHTRFNVDPMLFVDSATGRAFAGGLDGACSLMGITDDGGRSWIPAGNMCVATLDHQTIAAGPWALPLPTAAVFPRATYYCAQASAVTCVTSFDGGVSWGPTSAVTCGAINPGFHGSLTVAQNGHVFLPFKDCGGGAGVAVSVDNGLTWEARRVAGARYPGDGFDPDVATTPSGWLYVGYANGTRGAATVALSKDDGLTWSTPKDVGASVGVVTSTFHEMVAGDDDRAALAFLGTTSPGNAFEPGFTGVWDLYVATTYDAGQTWTTVKASTDPVQRGFICDGGVGCSSGRNLLDFMDAQVDASGRILVAYADGCTAACALPNGTAAMSRDAQATITRQDSGLTLFSRFDAEAGGFFVTGHGPYRGAPGTGIALAGVAAGGEAPYAYHWSVLTRPEGSAAGSSSFSDPTSATATFTPDLAGPYTLRLEARDARGAVAVDVVDLEGAPATGTAIPECSITLAADPAGDTLAVGAGAGRRDVVAMRASDRVGEWALCAEVADMSDRAPDATRFVWSWGAGYEAPGLAYSAVVTVTPQGTISDARVFRGAALVHQDRLGNAAIASIAGDTLVLRLSKPGVGGPADGETATDIALRVETFTVAPLLAQRWDEAGGALSYDFGHKLPETTPPSQVADLAVSDPGSGSVLDLAWSAATDDVGVVDYVVGRSTLAGGPYRTVAVTSALAHRDASLVQDTPYYYVVAARDAAGNVGAPSVEVAATPRGPGAGDVTPPTAPGAIVVDEVAATWARLSWLPASDDESGVARYVVSRDGQVVASTPMTSVRVDGLRPDSTHALEVRAVDHAGLVGPPASILVDTLARPEDCGQAAAAFTLVVDADGDASRGDGRAEVLRVGVRETASRIWFHVGLDNASAPAPATMFRVAWQTDATRGFSGYVRLTDDGTSPAGLFVTTPAGEVNTQRHPQFALQCESVLVGFQKADIGNPAPGSLLQQVRVRVSADTTSPAPGDVYDEAPSSGGVDYVVGSAA